MFKTFKFRPNKQGFLAYSVSTLFVSIIGPFIGHNTPAYANSQAVTNEIIQPPENDASLERVRIALRLVPYEKVVGNLGQANATFQAKPAKALQHILRASLNRSNHFYFNGFHLETSPLTWNKVNNQYTLKISLARQYGEQGEVEEGLGDLVLKGKLTGQSPLYVLQGSSQQQFKNKFNEPIFELWVGNPEQQSTASSANTSSTPEIRPQHGSF